MAKWGKALHIRLRDKNKSGAQRRMVQKLTDDNARILEKKLGRKPTDGDLYIAHFLGARDGAALLTANEATPNRKAAYLFSRVVVDSNRGIFFEGKRARTVRQTCQLLNDRVA